MISFEYHTKASLNEREFNLGLSPDKRVRRQITLILYELNRAKHNLHRLVIARKYDDGKIVGAYLEYRSRAKKKCSSTTNLYNIFSLEPGVGSALLQHWWMSAYSDSNALFKIHSDDRAAPFYHKFGFKWWNIDSYGKSFSTFGPILDADILKSNNKFFSDPAAFLKGETGDFMISMIRQSAYNHKVALTKHPRSLDLFNENKVSIQTSSYEIDDLFK